MEKGEAKENFKQKEIKRILPLVWSSYQHMFDVRNFNSANKINYLLVVLSFLSAISVGLFIYYKHFFFILSLVIQLIAFLHLSRVIFIKKPSIHWFELKETLSEINEGKFDENLLATLKALEPDTNIYQNKIEEITKEIWKLVIYSFLLTSFTLLYILLDNNLGLTLLLIFILAVIWTSNKNNIKFDFDENYPKNQKIISEWIKT